jgi:ribose transport system ATP-binding protein
LPFLISDFEFVSDFEFRASDFQYKHKMTSTKTTPLLECRGIGKRFGGVTALEGVDLTLQAGEVHGLVGSNGAGKSTLMKILAGAVPDHDGTILIDGAPVRLENPAAALRQGVAMVYQELSGIGQLSVAENLFLGRQPTGIFGRIHWRRMNSRAREFLHEMEIDIDVERRLDRYPLVIRQMVEIARGLHSGARILILDEPTSALSPPETRRLFTLIRQLQARGVAVIFISHFIEDVLEICDRVTILKDGRRLETADAKDFDKHRVIQTMLGHQLDAPEVGYESGATLPPRTSTPPSLVVEQLSLPGVFRQISLAVAPGECLGLYGFVGAGHQELAHAIAGSLRPTGGRTALDGLTLKPGNTHFAVQRGVVLVAADRAQTLVRGSEIYKNVTLAHLRTVFGNWLTSRAETNVVEPLLGRVQCRPPLPRLKAGQLSGGNQQKVVLAKWLLGPVRVLVLEEPTRGMDVGAKEEVMRLVRNLKREGAAVILASTEPELLLAHADRILTYRRGEVTHEFSGTSVDKTTLMRFA